MFDWPLHFETLVELDRVANKKFDETTLRKYARNCVRHYVSSGDIPGEYELNLNLFLQELFKDTNVSENYSRWELGTWIHRWLYEILDKDIDDQLTQLLAILRERRDEWCIFTPLVNLELDGESQVGDVHFFVAPNSVYEEVRKTMEDMPTIKGRVCAETIVICGASTMKISSNYVRAKELGTNKIRYILNLIRLIKPNCSSLDFLGGVGGYNLAEHFRASGGGTPTYEQERTGPFAPLYKCAPTNDEIRTIQLTYQVIETLVEKFRQDEVDMGTKVKRFVYWLGEASREPVEEAKFLKKIIALETLLVWDDNERKKKIISERGTFFLGGEGKADFFRRKLAQIYDKRSELVHSGGMILSRAENGILDTICYSVLTHYLSSLSEAKDYADLRRRVEQDIASVFPIKG